MYNIREQERLHQQRRAAARLARRGTPGNNQVPPRVQLWWVLLTAGTAVLPQKLIPQKSCPRYATEALAGTLPVMLRDDGNVGNLQENYGKCTGRVGAQDG